MKKEAEMGANKKPEATKKSIAINVMITKKRKDEYMAAAANAELSYSDWIRQTLDKQEEKDRP